MLSYGLAWRLLCGVDEMIPDLSELIRFACGAHGLSSL
jgi:hypothetical protein